MNNLVKNEKLQMVVVATATAIGAEFKIHPFQGDVFRIGFGVSTFLLFLLFTRHLPYIKTGIITGILNAVLQNSLAAGAYYLIYAFGMSRIQKRLDRFQPLVLGGIVTAIDFASNVTELLLHGLMLGTYRFSFHEWCYLFMVAILRSYFIIGLFSSISINQMRALHAEQEKRIKQMLNVGAGLYGEAIYLRKSMETIERITASSFDLYRKLKKDRLCDYSRQTIAVAQQLHEVKKDSQRILAGLRKLYDDEIVFDLTLTEIVRFVVEGNREYSEMLKKKIVIEAETEVKRDLCRPDYFPLMTVLNNLVANAVEAIDKQGAIHLKVFEDERDFVFIVRDSGRGIPEELRGIIFEPGFTTKFNEKGVSANGIGLSHVREIVRSFGGHIAVEPAGRSGGSRFVVRLPKPDVEQGGHQDVS
ncbi:two-component system sensor histidine kinase YcbA [Paenibacillus rhizosphaerae]|uniref:histidine kinase n=1 Tax=Paenibacillus rhizosphaerae TaxID=297318 RepID=A0A839TSK0_9BACL|nr:ATP-binding protein [Paenibacillus rhizosphaerae]MBB3130054.1 two-component system sensor histidine kinase YcbA [Paenibacillus rhizosphaerae]